MVIKSFTFPTPTLMSSRFLLPSFNSMVNHYTYALAQDPCPLFTLSVCVAKLLPWKIQLSSCSATAMQEWSHFTFMITMTLTSAGPLMLRGNAISLLHSLVLFRDTIPGLLPCPQKATPPPPP